MSLSNVQWDPRTDGPRGGVSASRPASSISGKSRVLIVEDEELVRESLGLLLEEEGYEVSFAENGHEALTRLYTQLLPDVIALDLRMPVMDGWEFRAIQKGDPKLADIPVVAISADGSAQAAAISAEAYLQRPVDARQLLTTIERVLSEKGLRPANHQAPGQTAAHGPFVGELGNEINNPLAFVVLNLCRALESLRPAVRAVETSGENPLSADEVAGIKSSLREIGELLKDCEASADRLRPAGDDIRPDLARPHD